MSDQNNQDQSPLIAVSQTTTQDAQAPADNTMIESTLTTEDVAANTDEGLIGFFAEEISPGLSEATDRAVDSYQSGSVASQLIRNKDGGFTTFGEMGMQPKTSPVGEPTLPNEPFKAVREEVGDSFPPDSVAARHPHTASVQYGSGRYNHDVPDMSLEPSFGSGPDFRTPPEFMSPNPNNWPRFGGQVGMPARPDMSIQAWLDGPGAVTPSMFADKHKSRYEIVNVISDGIQQQALIEIGDTYTRTSPKIQLITSQVLPVVNDVALRDVFPCYVLAINKDFAKRLFELSPALFDMMFVSFGLRAELNDCGEHMVYKFYTGASTSVMAQMRIPQLMHDGLVKSIQFLIEYDGRNTGPVDLSKAGL